MVDDEEVDDVEEFTSLRAILDKSGWRTLSTVCRKHPAHSRDYGGSGQLEK